MDIRPSMSSDLTSILQVELDAFSGDAEIRELVTDLFSDESAKPLTSLLAWENDKAVGHVYFSAATLQGAALPVKCAILAPLAVVQARQKQGVGTALIRRGLALLKEAGVQLVFVLGHPEYYPRCGFTPAGRYGFLAPYPIPGKDAAAWMVLALADDFIEKTGGGKVICANALMQPRYWRE